jgi:hypothetical protein
MVNNKMELLQLQLREALDLDLSPAQLKQREQARKLEAANKARAEFILRTIKMQTVRNNAK